MKKIIFFLIICMLILPINIFADELDPWDEYDNAQKGFRMKDRTFEIGFNGGIGFSNDFIGIRDIFQKTVVLDFDEVSKGFNIHAGARVTPFYLSINIKNNWGFSLSANAEAYGILGLSENLLSLNEAVNDKSDVGGAAFVDGSLDVFFHIERFKIKFRPSVYYAAAYMKSEAVYTFDGNNRILTGDFSMRLFTAMSLDPDNSGSAITASPGFDFSLGVEYPLARAIGLNKIFPVLDFDVGIDLINFPGIPSTLKDYMLMSGGFSMGDTGGLDFDDFFDSWTSDMMDDVEYYDNGKLKVSRPFKAIVWANWRPVMGSQLLTITPSIGFAVNDLYNKPWSFEGGITTRLDLANIFIVTVGINYNDRMWINSLGMTLNFRLLELNFGVDMRSHDFVKSWKAAGLGAYVGVKLGW